MSGRWLSKFPKCEIVLASPEVVDELLSMNVGNRKVRPSHTRYLRAQINRGNFVLTNQGVGIDVDGVLIDGQHRLHALRDAGYPQAQLLIAYGLPKAARAAVDLGVKRTVGDIMHFAFEHPEASATMIATARAFGQFVINSGKAGKPSPEDVRDWYMALLPAMERVFAINGASKLPASVLAAICHRISVFPSDARPLEFVEKLLTGEFLEKTSPVYKLREWLGSNRRSAKGGYGMQIERFDKTANALSAYLQGRAVLRLHARREAAANLVAA